MSYRLRLPTLNDLPPVTKALVIAVFCGWALHAVFGRYASYYLGLVPAKVLRDGWLWQLATYMVLHGGFWHLFFNGIMLWFLGPALEPALGSRKYLVYFLFCGVAAGILTVLVSPSSFRPVVGASGAIYGLMYAFAALYPDQVVYMYFFFPMTARQLVWFLAGISLLLSFTAPNSGVANFTHLSGLAAGWLWFKVPDWLSYGLSYKLRSIMRKSAPRVTSEQERVDEILEKISRKGGGSLTEEERAVLDDYARRRGGRA